MLHSWIGDDVSLTTVYHRVLPLPCLCWAPHIIHLQIGMKAMTYDVTHIMMMSVAIYIYIH